MRTLQLVATTAMLAVAALCAAADVSSLIRVEDLPQDEAVLRAWADAVAQERYAASWSHEWKHPVSKEAVARVLAGSLATLRRAEKSGDNTELLLAIGLTARYAHNVDVDGAPEAGVEALTKAASRSGVDPRPEWFLGSNLCAMGRADAIPHFNAAQARRGAKPLPAAYWGDLLACAHVSGMPAHAIHASNQLEKLSADTSFVSGLVAADKALLLEPDPSAEIPAKEAWVATQVGDRRRLGSRACGFAMWLRPEWSVPPVKKGGCMTTGPLGPFPGKQGRVFPSVLVLARIPRKGETLDAFLSSFPVLSDRVAVEGYPCPATACRSYESRRPGDYVPEGGGFVIAVVFEREEPETRGLALETPQPPTATPNGQVHYFRPIPHYVRFPGKMFYLVLLDSAQSVAESAKAEYRRFLNELIVE